MVYFKICCRETPLKPYNDLPDKYPQTSKQNSTQFYMTIYFIYIYINSSALLKIFLMFITLIKLI